MLSTGLFEAWSQDRCFPSNPMRCCRRPVGINAAPIKDTISPLVHSLRLNVGDSSQGDVVLPRPGRWDRSGGSPQQIEAVLIHPVQRNFPFACA